MTLTDDQRAGLTRFLGASRGYESINGRHYFEFATHYPSWNDADLMLALLERATALKYEAVISTTTMRLPWDCEMWRDGQPAVLGQGQACEAVILAVLQLPEAQP